MEKETYKPQLNPRQHPLHGHWLALALKQFKPDHSLSWRANRSISGCLAAFWASTHQILRAPVPSQQSKPSPDIAKCPHESKTRPKLRSTVLESKRKKSFQMIRVGPGNVEGVWQTTLPQRVSSTCVPFLRKGWGP